jgi:hypothetical protein
MQFRLLTQSVSLEHRPPNATKHVKLIGSVRTSHVSPFLQSLFIRQFFLKPTRCLSALATTNKTAIKHKANNEADLFCFIF